MITFSDLALIPQLLKSLKEVGYETPTPIQIKSIPSLLEGQDLLGLAQTGTGKTAAFALPIIQLLMAQTTHSTPLGRSPRALILAPTRELAAQIADNINLYAKHTSLKCTVIFGGVKQGRQVEQLQKGTDILVAAPGRLLDLMEQGHISLENIAFFVLDEADRMLDMGFINDIRRIITRLPSRRQTMLFSATMPRTIQDLANSLLKNPVQVEIVPQSTTAERIKQAVMYVDVNDKKPATLLLVQSPTVQRAVIFTLMKHEANKVAEFLQKNGVPAGAIHGNKSQNAREKTLNDFRNGTLKVLVATDIAARGIDIDDVSHVFNYDIPNLPESYVHRIGRTGRAGREGWAVSLCEGAHRQWWDNIERTIDQSVNVVREHPYHSDAAEFSTLPPPSLTGKRRQSDPGQRRSKSRSASKMSARAAPGHRSKHRSEAGPSAHKERHGHLGHHAHTSHGSSEGRADRGSAGQKARRSGGGGGRRHSRNEF